MTWSHLCSSPSYHSLTFLYSVGAVDLVVEPLTVTVSTGSTGCRQVYKWKDVDVLNPGGEKLQPKTLHLVFNHRRYHSLTACSFCFLPFLHRHALSDCLCFTWTLHDELNQILCKFDGCWCSTCLPINLFLFSFSIHYFICSFLFLFATRSLIFPTRLWLYYSDYFMLLFSLTTPLSPCPLHSYLCLFPRTALVRQSPLFSPSPS